MLRDSSTITAVLAATLLVAGVVACGKSPAGPSAVRTASSSEAGRPPIRVTGLVVDAIERPVAGARITIPTFGTKVLETFADATGAYSLEIDPVFLSHYVYVEKEGFEPSQLIMVTSRVEPGEELRRNLRLHEILRIGAGAAQELSVREGDSVCDDMDGWQCRRVRVVSPVAGLLSVEVPSTGSTFVAGFFLRVQGFPNYDFRPFFRGIAVAAGSETILDVMLVGAPAGMTVLTTRLEPS